MLESENFNPASEAQSVDDSFAWSVIGISQRWEKHVFPIGVSIKPVSYGGGSQNNFALINVTAGANPAIGTGADTHYEVVPAGKAFRLPPGTYWLRTDPAQPNTVNCRVTPGDFTKNQWLSRGQFLPPDQVSVGVASAQALAARIGRSFLSLDNLSNATISIAFNLGPAVANKGLVLGPGENVILTGEDCPEDAVFAIATVAASLMAVQEG